MRAIMGVSGRANERTDGRTRARIGESRLVDSIAFGKGGAPRAIEDFSFQSPRSMMMYSHAHPWAGYFFLCLDALLES